MKKWWGVVILIVGLIGGGALGYFGASTHSQTPKKAVTTVKRDFQKPQHSEANATRIFLNASQNKSGNTANLAKQLFGSHSYQQINLANYHVPQVGQGEGDFSKIWQQLKKAKVIVIGTPVYWSNMSGYLKTFIDHLAVNSDLKGSDLYLIVQGASEDQTVAINATYGTINRVAKRFGLNFAGIAQTPAQIKQLQQKLYGKS